MIIMAVTDKGVNCLMDGLIKVVKLYVIFMLSIMLIIKIQRMRNGNGQKVIVY